VELSYIDLTSKPDSVSV